MVKFIITFMVTMWCLGIVLTSFGSHARSQIGDYSKNHNKCGTYSEIQDPTDVYCREIYLLDREKFICALPITTH